MIKQYKSVGDLEGSVAKLQQNIYETLTSICGSKVLDGVLVRDVALITGQVNIVDHKLGRIPLGWMVAGLNADARVWATPANLPSKSLELNCSANCTINLWVF